MSGVVCADLPDWEYPLYFVTVENSVHCSSDDSPQCLKDNQELAITQNTLLRNTKINIRVESMQAMVI